MQVRRVLVVEDDHFQREAITEAIKEAAPRDLRIDVTPANSETAASNALDAAERAGTMFDAFVIDLHLPWSQEDSFPTPSEDVVRDGPLVAGFRIADRITNTRAGQKRPGNNSVPLIVIYTIDDGPDVMAFEDKSKRRYGLVKGDDDKDLAGLLIRLLD